MLYSHHATIPAPLPHRIRFPDGSTRTDASTFTAAELELAGFTGPYERPTHDPTIETVDWNSEALVFLVRPYNDAETQAQRARVREQYVALLKSSDWTQISDYDLGLTQEAREAWAVYRQALRDLAAAPNPFAIAWPQPPAPAPTEP